jgi:hypothetical protein
MADTPPIACTLDDDERPEREREIGSLGSEGLLTVERAERSATLRFRPDPGIRDRVEAIAAAEGRCCAFLAFDVTAERDATVLKIEAPGGGESVMQELVSAFQGGLPWLGRRRGGAC